MLRETRVLVAPGRCTGTTKTERTRRKRERICERKTFCSSCVHASPLVKSSS